MQIRKYGGSASLNRNRLIRQMRLTSRTTVWRNCKWLQLTSQTLLGSVGRVTKTTIGGFDSRSSYPGESSGSTGDRQVTTETSGGNSETSAGPGVSGRIDGSEENASIILRGTSAFMTTAPDTNRPAGLDRHEVFFMWEIGSSHLEGLRIAVGRKTTTDDRREGFASRISSNTRPHDHGGGGGQSSPLPTLTLRRGTIRFHPK